jgi:hypothetical protein
MVIGEITHGMSLLLQNNIFIINELN